MYANKNCLVMTCDTSREDKGNKIKEKWGLFNYHTYTIMDAKEVFMDQPGKNRINTDKILQLRDPFGESEWLGDWGDGSELWTKYTLAQVNQKFREGYVEEDGDDSKPLPYGLDNEEGTFWISFWDFMNYFKYSTICYWQ
jgi:hypothetical protein